MTGSLFLLCRNISSDKSKSCLTIKTFSDQSSTVRVVLATCHILQSFQRLMTSRPSAFVEMDLPNIDDALKAQHGIEGDALDANHRRAAALPVTSAQPAIVDVQQGLRRRHDVGREDPPHPPWPQLPAGGWHQGHRQRLEVGREDPPLPPWPQMPAGGWHQHVNNDNDDGREDPAVPAPLSLTFWGYTIPAPSIDDLFRLLHLIHNVYYISAAILGRIEANAILLSCLLCEIHYVTGYEYDEDQLVIVWWVSVFQDWTLRIRRLLILWKCIRPLGEMMGWRWVRRLDGILQIAYWAPAFWHNLPGPGPEDPNAVEVLFG